MAKSKNGSKFAIGAVLAAAAGYVAGVLSAPKSGKETRQDIKDVAAKSVSEIEKKLKTLHTELDKVIKNASDKAEELGDSLKKEFKAALDKADKAKTKAREALSAVHEGQSTDEELQKVIKNVEDAISNLTKFIKK